MYVAVMAMASGAIVLCLNHFASECCEPHTTATVCSNIAAAGILKLDMAIIGIAPDSAFIEAMRAGDAVKLCRCREIAARIDNASG